MYFYKKKFYQSLDISGDPIYIPGVPTWVVTSRLKNTSSVFISLKRIQCAIPFNGHKGVVCTFNCSCDCGILKSYTDLSSHFNKFLLHFWVAPHCG